MNLESTILQNKFQKNLAILLIIFFISRFILYYLGMYIQNLNALECWQCLDVSLLKKSLMQSIWYLHSQPPGFNLFVGIILKLFPNNEPIVFHLIYSMFGLGIAIFLYLLLIRMLVPASLATLISVLFIIGPGCISYEAYLSYTYPLVLELCAISYFFHRYLSSHALKDGFIFFSLIAIIMLTHSVFQLPWFILIGSLVLLAERSNWKKVLFVMLIPFLIILSVYVKNFILFDNFSTSSWLGMNLYRTTTSLLKRTELESLSKNNLTSPYVLLQPYGPIDLYGVITKKTGIPALDERIKTNINKNNSSQNYNFNNLAYINISKQYLKDSLKIISMHPTILLKAYPFTFYLYFLPAKSQNANVRLFDKIYNTLLLGQFVQTDVIKKYNFTRNDTYNSSKISSALPHNKNYFFDLTFIMLQFFLHTGVFLVITWPIVLLYTFKKIFKNIQAIDKTNKAYIFTLCFITINILYVTLIANTFEMGENNRHRFEITPLFCILLGIFIADLINKYKNFFRINNLIIKKV